MRLPALTAASLVATALSCLAETGAVVTARDASPRELYAASILNDALAGAKVRLPEGSRILVGTLASSLFGNTAPFQLESGRYSVRYDPVCLRRMARARVHSPPQPIDKPILHRL